jgi:glycerol dehydrogenase
VAFQGEATSGERQRVTEIARSRGADISVGIGGGKILDVAKAVAVDAGLKMVTCPTIASNDSPTSAASVWYDDDHNFVGFDCWPFNPDIVLVDTQVIANGPYGPLWRAWEMPCRRGSKPRRPSSRGLEYRGRTPDDGRDGHLAQAVLRNAAGARLGRQTRCRALTSSRRPWKRSSRPTCCCPGLGFESGGLATAHMIGNLLSNVPECQKG